MKTRSTRSTRPAGAEKDRARVPSSPARKRFGQHFLEPAWVAKVVDVIQPGADDLFLEIGPGRGELTARVAAAGARVVAVEVDRDLAARVRGEALPGVQILTGDVLDQDLAHLVTMARNPGAGRARLIGNLPYNLSSPILGAVLRAQHRTGCFTDATLMLQREVADRVTGVPATRAYGPLAILTRMFADAERMLEVPPGAFRPPPQVRSAVVRLTFRPCPVEVRDMVLFERLVRSVFTRRRKMLLNALVPFARMVSTIEPREMLALAGIAPDRRPDTLDLPELARLADTAVDVRGH